MTDRSKVKEFLTAIAQDDYVTANEMFPDVVKSSVKTIINKRKPDVIKKANNDTSELVSRSLKDDEKDDEKEEEKRVEDEE